MTLQRDARRVAQKLVGQAPVVIGEPDLTELARSLRHMHLDAGRVLYRAARPVEGIWIIGFGHVEISHGAGCSRCVVSIERPGDVVGDTFLLLDAVPTITARCTDETECWFVSAERFRKLIACYPSIAMVWSCQLARRLARSRQRMVDLISGNLVQRLVRLLLREASESCVRLPQKTIAQMLGLQRTSVNKVLKELERDGLVDLGYGMVLLKDVPALESRICTPPRLPRRSVVSGPGVTPGAATERGALLPV